MYAIPAGYLLAGTVAYAGYRARALSASGAITAWLVGGTIFGFGGLIWALLLVLFFASSSILSFFKSSDARKSRAADIFEKGGRRDAAQVLANGGVTALLALVVPVVPASALPFVYVAFASALAEATADTWATELGVLSNRPPRLITTGRQVVPGTSGGITWLGTCAAAAGALSIALCASLFALFRWHGAPAPDRPWLVLLCATLGGIAGGIADSLLGATVQAGYYCPVCNKPTESATHRCGTRAQLVQGLAWMNNDLVNLLATLVSTLIGGGLWALVYNEF